MQGLERWVEGGGHLLVLGRREWFSVTEPSETLGPPTRAQTAGKGGATHPTQPVALMRGVRNIALASEWRFAPDLSAASGERLWVVLLADAHGPVLTMRRFGKGVVYACCDVGLFSNSRLGQADNAVLAFNFASAAPERTVIFEEYHQGFGRHPSFWLQVWAGPKRWVTVQVAAVLLLFVYGSGVRFGRPLARPSQVKRRAASEYAVSMASLYRRAGSTGPALALLLRGFRQSVAPALSISPAASDKEVLAAIAGMAPDLAEGARRLLSDCVRAAEIPRLPPAVFLRLAQELDRLRRKIIEPHA